MKATLLDKFLCLVIEEKLCHHWRESVWCILAEGAGQHSTLDGWMAGLNADYINWTPIGISFLLKLPK